MTCTDDLKYFHCILASRTRDINVGDFLPSGIYIQSNFINMMLETINALLNLN